MSSTEPIFDQDDQAIFMVEDPQLKADAIKYSILPRLQHLLNVGIGIIHEVFNIDVLENSTITRSPNFRPNRKNTMAYDYQWGAVGLTGKVVKGMWPGLQRPDGKLVKLLPFRYEIGFAENGLQFRLRNGMYQTITPASFRRLFSLHDEYRGLIHTLCYRAAVSPVLYWGNGCEPFASFDDYVAWSRDAHIVQRDYYSKQIAIPVTLDRALDLLFSFVIFFPVYDSYLQIAKGELPRINYLVDCLNEWYKNMVHLEENIAVGDWAADPPDKRLTEKAKELAAQRIRVVPSLRYQVFWRDNFRCVACGRRGGDDDVILHLDHIVPRSKGGEDTLDNLQTLCSECNLGKSNRDDTDLRKHP